MDNWKDSIRKEEKKDWVVPDKEVLWERTGDSDPQVRAKLMDVYRNLNFELKEAAKELEKHGDDIRNSEGYVSMMIHIKERWEWLRDAGEFGFGNRGTEIDE